MILDRYLSGMTRKNENTKLPGIELDFGSVPQSRGFQHMHPSGPPQGCLFFECNITVQQIPREMLSHVDIGQHDFGAQLIT
jgi:hypothetical protein